MLEVIIFLLVGHLISDYLLQTDTIAIGKNKNTNKMYHGVPWYYWLSTHAAVHASAVYFITSRIELFIMEFVFHFIIDYIKCDNKINLHTDQGLHILCKVIYLVYMINLGLL